MFLAGDRSEKWEQDVDTKWSSACTVTRADKPNVRAVRVIIEKGTDVLLKCFLEPFCRYKYIYIYLSKNMFYTDKCFSIKDGSKAIV